MGIRQSEQWPAIPANVEGHLPSGLEVVVLFTGVPATLLALRTAAQLAQGLHARIRLLAPQCVPYPLPLNKPPVSSEAMERRLQRLAMRSQLELATAPAVSVSVEIVYCREVWDAVEARVRPQSVIVVGRRGGWWPKAEDRVAGKLRTAGHHVVRTAVQKGTHRWTFSTSLSAFFSSLFVGRW